jgi:hypothetical protein
MTLERHCETMRIEPQRSEEPAPILLNMLLIIPHTKTQVHPQRFRAHATVASAHAESDIAETREDV